MEQPVKFEIKGRISPEKLYELTHYLAKLMLVETIDYQIDKEEIDIEDTFDTTYLELVKPQYKKGEAYLVTRNGIKVYFNRNEPDLSRSKVNQIWDSLSSHYIYHHIIRSRICSCPLEGEYRESIGRRHFREEKRILYEMLGFYPESIEKFSEYLRDNPDLIYGREMNIGPASGPAIQRYAAGILRVHSEE